MSDTAAILKETRARLDRLLERRAANRVSLRSVLFGAQREFFDDPATFADAVCSRRAGKSVGVSAWLLEGPIKNPKAPSLYLTLTRGSAKRNIWATLLDLNRKLDLGYEPNEADLVLKKDGVAKVFLVGIDNRSEIDKIRGTGWGRVAIDEAQSLPQYVKELVEDVLMPALADHNGQVRMIGTPPPVPAGYFHEVSQSPHWRHHSWTVWENPHVPGARAMLDRTLAVRGITEDDPSIQREWFGRWVLDVNALVFRYDPAKNSYDALPNVATAWSHVIGVDLGYDDADAIAVLAFNPELPSAYLREEWVGSKQTITQLAERLTRLVSQYKPNAVVMDTGGLGKKIAEEISSRTGLPLQAAEKSRKLEFIELLNDAMRSGRFMARKDSRFARDAMLVEWDKEKSVGDKRVISDRFHSDVVDAVLYAFRESLHWLHKPTPQAPAHGSEEWGRATAQAIMEKTRRDVLAQKRANEGGDWGGMTMDDWGGSELGGGF